jgi:hypothetical protein
MRLSPLLTPTLHRRLQGVNAAACDHRVLAVCVFGAAASGGGGGDDATAFVAAAGCRGSVQLLHLQVSSRLCFDIHAPLMLYHHSWLAATCTACRTMA